MRMEKTGSAARWVMYSLLGLGVLVIVLLMMLPRPLEKTEAAPEKARAVTTEVLRAETIPDVVSIPGRVEANIEAVLSAEKPGLIVEMTADKGDRVRQGQVLMRVDDRSWKALADKAQIDLREAEKSLRRWEELRKTGAVSVDEYDSIKARQELAAVALQDAQAHLERCRIVSPCDGVVADRLLDPGEYAREGDAAFVVVQIAPAKLVLNVSERDVGSLQPGQPVPFTVESLSGLSCTGRVSFVAPMAARDSNSFRVEALVDNENLQLKPGLIARAQLERRMFEQALAVPLSAVVPQKGEYVVFVVKDGRAVRRVLRIESIVDQRAVVASGVSEGEELVVEGARTLLDGAAVTTPEAP